jgi:Multicopper oxidase
MSRFQLCLRALAALSLLIALPAGAQSFRVQCPTSTITHPATNPNSPTGDNNSEPTYTAGTYVPVPTSSTLNQDFTTGKSGPVNGAIKCQQVSGGDGYATMADGTQTYMFAFGPLSGVVDISNGNPGTEPPGIFNAPYYPTNPATGSTSPQPLPPGYPAVQPSGGPVTYNGAIGLANDVAQTFNIYSISEGCSAALPAPCSASNNTVTVVLNAASPFKVGDTVVIGQGPNGTDLNGYVGSWTVTATNVANNYLSSSFAFQYTDTTPVPPATQPLAEVVSSADGTASSLVQVTGHVDPRQIMDVGVMNGNQPAPLIAIDEDDELFLTLTNVGMIMRPDLFEQHTIHFHGYPNASAFFDGVPDASVAINIGGSFTYYYLAPDAGTYFWHCHITPPEHLQMGMVGQLYVRPRQNRVPAGTDLGVALKTQQGDLRTACNANDLLCSNSMPFSADATTGATGVVQVSGAKYAYNDGDGSTRYDVEYPLQMHGFDPNFHFVGMTFNPEGFTDMKDKYFLLNGRSYPDTVTPGAMQTPSADGQMHDSQPMSSIINIPAGGKALLRISELNVSEYHTLSSLGIPMHVIGWNAKLLRDQAGNNMDYYTNSITMGGGESCDVILDASNTNLYPKGSVFYLYTTNLDHLSNDAENFGGQMTEVRIN